MKYIARRTFASLEPGDGLVEAGDSIEINSKSVAKDMQDNGLIWPEYRTKEDKRAYKVGKKGEPVTIQWDAGQMFYVKRGDEVIDRLKKSEAVKLRDKLNGVSA